jgi:salicylate hydroxylase
MDLTGLNVAIVGGGIGGMAAATALAQRGAEVVLHEQAPALTEVGAGLQVSMNGQRVLRALGAVGDDPPTSATVAAGTIFRDGRSGRQVARVPAPRDGPTWYMHRADLLEHLMRVARDAGVSLDLGRLVTPGTLRADLVVAADGVRSLWRSAVDGPVEPAFTGQVAWRALVPWTGDTSAAASVSLGHRAHVVSYPLRGGRLMNLVAVEERRDWTSESWSQTGDAAEFRDRFSDFRGTVGEAIARVDMVHVWALHSRSVAHRWRKDNVVLLGDAAHPTLPFIAQGACLALEDAWVLADALEAAPDLGSGLASFQSLRRGRAERVVALARGNAWRFHMGWPFNWGAYATLHFGGRLLGSRLEWVYGYDATRAA